MAYYNVCPVCGSNLDPGERCDCQSIRAKEQEKNRLFFSQMLRTEKNSGQMSFAYRTSNRKKGWTFSRKDYLPVCTSVSVGTAGHGRAAGCGKYG